MNSGRITDVNWKKQNSRLIGMIQERINGLNQNRLKGLISEDECLNQKPTCIYQNESYTIVGYSYCVSDHRYLKFSLKQIGSSEYSTIFAYHLDSKLIKIL